MRVLTIVAVLLVAATGCRAAAEAVKVLVIGNSGRGKSTLLNVILAETFFPMCQNYERVTTAVKSRRFDAPDGRSYELYDMPGLLDIDTAVTKLNAIEIEKAFRDSVNTPVIALFVVGNPGGRPLFEDIETWNTLTEFAPSLRDPTVVLFIANKIPTFKTGEKQMEFEIGFKKRLRAQLGANYTIMMVPALAELEDPVEYSAPKVENLRLELLLEMGKLHGKSMESTMRERIRLQEERTKEEIDEAKRKFDEKAREADDLRKASEQERQQYKAERENLNRVIERLQKDQKDWVDIHHGVQVFRAACAVLRDFKDTTDYILDKRECKKKEECKHDDL